MKRLVIHTPLMRLVRDEEDQLLGSDPDERGNEYYFWHPSSAPSVYKDTTPFRLANEIMDKERSFDNPDENYMNRVYDVTKTYPISASHNNEIETVTFKVELKTDSLHSFFWHHISYARMDSWGKKDDPRLLVFYDQ